MIRIRPLYAAALTLVFCGFGIHALRAAPAIPRAAGAAPAQTAASEGKTIFEGTCSGCHGFDGAGGTGPNIRNAAARLGPDGIENMIKVGFIGSGMPTFGQLGDEKIRQIVDYVVSFEQEGSSVAPGDPQKGKAVYDSTGCSKCHIVDGRGGDLGPDLTRIGSVRSPGSLRAAILAPGSNLPLDAQLAERAPYRAHVMYRAVTQDGREITGMRVNEDSFSIQLRDADGKLHSLEKLSLRTLEELPGKSLMPSYKDALSDTQITDLLGYLASLRGAQ